MKFHWEGVWVSLEMALTIIFFSLWGFQKRICKRSRVSFPDSWLSSLLWLAGSDAGYPTLCQIGLCPGRACPTAVVPIRVLPVEQSICDISTTHFFSYEEQHFTTTTREAKNALARKQLKNFNGQLCLCMYETQILVDYKCDLYFHGIWAILCSPDLSVSILLSGDIQHGLSVLQWNVYECQIEITQGMADFYPGKT